MKVLRRGHLRLVTLLSVAGVVLLYVYYHASTAPADTTVNGVNRAQVLTNAPALYQPQQQQHNKYVQDERAAQDLGMSLAVSGQKTPNDACPAVSVPVTDVDTVTQFPKFDFLVS